MPLMVITRQSVAAPATAMAMPSLARCCLAAPFRPRRTLSNIGLVRQILVAGTAVVAMADMASAIELLSY